MNQKKSAKIRIVCWSAAAVLLTAALVVGICGSLLGWWPGFRIGFGGGYYAHAEDYRAGSGEADAEIDAVEINWPSGTVKIIPYDGDTIQIEEESKKELPEAKQVHYLCRDGKLTIQYQASARIPFFQLGFGEAKEKKLTVRLPREIAQNLESCLLDCVSADAELEGLSMESLRYDSTSGGLTVKRVRTEKLHFDSTSGELAGNGLTVAETLEAETVSGDVEADGTAGEIRFDSVSGSMRLALKSCPQRVSSETVSGDMELHFPEGAGFTYSTDTVSGTVQSDFPVLQKGSESIYGDGTAVFSFDSVSGGVALRSSGEAPDSER